MSSKQLTTVSDSLVVPQFLYVHPTWGGFFSADLINKINAHLVFFVCTVMDFSAAEKR